VVIRRLLDLCCKAGGMIRRRLLDLCCKAGGAARGYADAGFEVVGVDIEPQPHYPYEFHQADALEFPLDGYDAIHASPPCQLFSRITGVCGDRSAHPNLIPAVRERLAAAGVPYVIENVEDAAPELRDYIRLCGSSFGLDVRRHRLFEMGCWAPLLVPPCAHHWQTPRFRSLNQQGRLDGKLSAVVGVYGGTNYAGELPLRKAAMGIDWMTNDELTQAIPPAYTEWIGHQLMAHLDEREAAA
jgi:hypothetical protein